METSRAPRFFLSSSRFAFRTSSYLFCDFVSSAAYALASPSAASGRLGRPASCCTSLNLYCRSYTARVLEEPIALVRMSISCRLLTLFSLRCRILNSISSLRRFSSSYLRAPAASSSRRLFSASSLNLASAFFWCSASFLSRSFFSCFSLFTSSLQSSYLSLSSGMALFTGCIRERGTLTPLWTGVVAPVRLSGCREAAGGSLRSRTPRTSDLLRPARETLDAS